LIEEKIQKVRIDKWLWYARFFKSRSLSSKHITQNGVRLNGKKIQKPAETVAAGDNITFNIGLTVKVIEILLCGSRRGPASEARSLYRERVSQTSIKDDKNVRVGERPTKKNRRLLEKIKMYSLE
jgi:ribosome-associated heat shock protein Hsp15